MVAFAIGFVVVSLAAGGALFFAYEFVLARRRAPLRLSERLWLAQPIMYGFAFVCGNAMRGLAPDGFGFLLLGGLTIMQGVILIVVVRLWIRWIWQGDPPTSEFWERDWIATGACAIIAGGHFASLILDPPIV